MYVAVMTSPFETNSVPFPTDPVTGESGGIAHGTYQPLVVLLDVSPNPEVRFTWLPILPIKRT